MHRGQIIPGIDVLCDVPSSMALAPQCPNVPMPQYCFLQCPTAPFSLSHGPIDRESTVPASMVPLSIVPRPHCSILALSIVPLSIAAWSILQMSHCPIVSLPHYPVVHCPGTRERSIVPVSQCAFVTASIIPLSVVPFPFVLLPYCSSQCPWSRFPLSNCDIVPLSHCHTAPLAISLAPRGSIVLSSHRPVVRPLPDCPIRTDHILIFAGHDVLNPAFLSHPKLQSPPHTKSLSAISKPR